MKNFLLKIKSKHILIIGILLRIVYFTINLFIGGSYVDEAILALNANSIANNLTDIEGEILPVYFDTWCYGGQSPLPTYLSAISVKLFGLNLFAVRLPMLIMSIAGLIAFYLFVEEVFLKNKEKLIINGIACISPWSLFSSTYVLDCNYLAHMLIIGSYFLAKTLNSKKIRYYIFSMMFFALGFYCYISSVFFIPVFLAVMFITLLVKKKTGIRETIVSFITVFIVSLPFIFFGLVNLDILPDIHLFGISITKMPYYIRTEDIALFNNGFFEYMKYGFRNISNTIPYFLFPELNVMTSCLNKFQYSNLFGGLFIVTGFVFLAISFFKNKNRFTFLQKCFSLSVVCGFFVYAFNINGISYYKLYRYGIFCYLLLFLEGIGIKALIDRVKSFKSVKKWAMYFVASVFIFNLVFFVSYPSFVKDDYTLLYGDSFYECLDATENMSTNNITIIDKFNPAKEKFSVYCRYYDCINHNEREYIKFSKEYEDRDINRKKEHKIAMDGSIRFVSPDIVSFSNDQIYFICKYNLNKIENIPDDYIIKTIGYMTLIYSPEIDSGGKR